MRKGIEKEVEKLLTQRPMTVIELAKALGYKTKKLGWGQLESAGAFKIRELEDKGLVEYRDDGKWYWVGNEGKTK